MEQAAKQPNEPHGESSSFDRKKTEMKTAVAFDRTFTEKLNVFSDENPRWDLLSSP